MAFPEKDQYTGMRRMIFFCMILVPVIPFIIVLGIGYYHFTTSLETSTLATMTRIVEDHRQMIDSFLRERRGSLGPTSVKRWSWVSGPNTSLTHFPSNTGERRRPFRQRCGWLSLWGPRSSFI